MKKKTLGSPIKLILLLLAMFAVTLQVRAADLTSTSFIIRDPMIGTGGGYGSSGSFSLFSKGNMTLSARNSSASFITRNGFLYYPNAVSGVLTATPNGPDMDLTWTASTAGNGWNISGYNTGIKPTGGAYSYTSVGNVLLYTYDNLTPGDYCFIVQTLDAFNNVITTSNEDCATIAPGLTFAVSAGQVEFGPLSFVSPRYATTSGGSGSNTVAHTMTASSNAVTGYTITYVGPTLTSGGNTISPATITGDVDGTQGSEEFAISVSTTGSASIPSAYQQTSSNWSFVPNTITSIASTSAPSNPETFSFRYLTNSATTTQSGNYSTGITYILTGNF